MNKHCKAAQEFIADAEAPGDARQAFYRRAAEEIEKAIENDRLTHQQVAAQIGKHYTYVGKLLKALFVARTTNTEFRVDWGSGASGAKTILPKTLETQVKLAAELLAKPGVADEIVRSRTLASSNVHSAVTRENVEQRDLGKQRAERRLHEQAMPVGAYHGRIVGKLQEWTGELVAIGPDLVESCENAFLARSIASSLRDLALQCTRLADRIELDVDPDVVEGKAWT